MTPTELNDLRQRSDADAATEKDDLIRSAYIDLAQVAVRLRDLEKRRCVVVSAVVRCDRCAREVPVREAIETDCGEVVPVYSEPDAMGRTVLETYRWRCAACLGPVMSASILCGDAIAVPRTLPGAVTSPPLFQVPPSP